MINFIARDRSYSIESSDKLSNMKPRDNTSLISTKRARKKVIHDLSLKLICRQENIVSESLLIHPWLTRYMVNGYVRWLKLKDQSAINSFSYY